MPFSTGLRLATRALIAGTVPPANYTGAASTDIYVSTKYTPHVTFLIYTGAWAGGTVAVTLLQATSAAAAGSKALAFDTMYTNKAAPTTAPLVSTAVVSNTFNLDTAASLWVVEVDASSLDVVNGFDYVALHGATPASNADYYAVIAISEQVRFSGATPPDFLA